MRTIVTYNFQIFMDSKVTEFTIRSLFNPLCPIDSFTGHNYTMHLLWKPF